MGLTKKLELIGTIELDAAEINSITPDAGNHLDLNAVASKDLRLYLSDNAGARKLLIYDSDDALVASIDSNGVITGTSLVGALTGNSAGTHTGNVAATASSALSISNAAADKNIVFKLGDANAATKISFTDSADAEQGSIDSNGTFDAVVSIAPMKYATGDTEGAPTDAECIGAFGAAATMGAGFVGIFKDSHESGKVYVCACDGSNYHVAEMTAAAT